MPRFTSDVHIARDLRDCFDFVSEPRNLPLWEPRARMVQYAGLPAEGRGGTVTWDLLGRPRRMDFEIETLSRPRLFVFRSYSMHIRFRMEMHFEEAIEGTFVRWEEEVRAEGLMQLLAPFLGRSAKSDQAASAGRLKLVLEAEDVPVRLRQVA